MKKIIEFPILQIDNKINVDFYFYVEFLIFYISQK